MPSSHDHAPGSHSHGGHTHHHAHPAAPPVSLLRMSLLQRLAFAGSAVAVIWLGVIWAMRAP